MTRHDARCIALVLAVWMQGRNAKGSEWSLATAESPTGRCA